MKWEEFKKDREEKHSKGLLNAVETDIECPICGKRIYEVLLTDIWRLMNQENYSKTYKTPDGRAAVFYYDRNGVGKITLESMDMLMGELIAYQQCIQSRSFWDSKHCDGCRFYDNCPFNPQEDEDEPQTKRSE